MRFEIAYLVKRHALVTFFVLVFGITWLVWVPRAATMHGLLAANWAVLVGRGWTYIPALTALLAAALTGGWPAVRDLGARLGRWRVGWWWYAVVLAGPLAVGVAVAGVWVALGGNWAAAAPPALTEGPGGGPLPVPQLALFFVLLALTDGLGEEPGWRGYALPRLLAGHGALPGSLLLGVVWAAWHLPLFWTVGAPLEGRSILLQFLALPALSILYTWVYRHTQGSLLLAVLFHAASNLWGLAALPPAGEEVTPALLRIGATWLLALGVIAGEWSAWQPHRPAATAPAGIDLPAGPGVAVAGPADPPSYRGGRPSDHRARVVAGVAGTRPETTVP